MPALPWNSHSHAAKLLHVCQVALDICRRHTGVDSLERLHAPQIPQQLIALAKIHLYDVPGICRQGWQLLLYASEHAFLVRRAGHGTRRRFFPMLALCKVFAKGP